MYLSGIYLGTGLPRLIEFFLRIAIKFARRIGTSDWPSFDATVISSKLDESFWGCYLAVIHYRYRNADKRYEGTYKQPFIYDNYATAYLHRYPSGSEFPIIVSPKHPSHSVPVEGKIDFIKVTPEDDGTPSSQEFSERAKALSSHREPLPALAQPLRPPPISAPSSGRRVPLASRIDAAARPAPQAPPQNSARPRARHRRED